jgi:hypothetical protein
MFTPAIRATIFAPVAGHCRLLFEARRKRHNAKPTLPLLPGSGVVD